MRLIKYLILIIILIIGVSCGGDENDDIVKQVIDPTAVTLNFPLNNTECNEGTILSESRSEVVFKWTATTNNDSYTVSLKNLETGVIKNYETSFEELSISILRGVAYSWWVVSKITDNPKTVESSIWKFYNAGIPKESHPPFPAEVNSPLMGIAVDAGTVNLQWSGSDIDNDIVSYTVLFDNSETPITSIGDTTTNSMNVEVESGKIYYWKVIAIDAQGNSSSSEIFQFKVN